MSSFNFYRTRLALIKERHAVISRAEERFLPKTSVELRDPHEDLLPSPALIESAERYSVSLTNDDGTKKSSLDIIKAIDFLSKDEWKCSALGDDWTPSSLDEKGTNVDVMQHRKEERYHIVNPESY